MNIKERLYNGDVIYGTFCKTVSSDIIECLAYSGFDFCILDLEHGPASMETIQNLIRTCQLSGICPIVRTSGINDYQITQSLDLGAQGIQIPQINSVNDVYKIIQISKFSPIGNRGVCRFVRSAGYSF
jgi:4-hydroxy-2-oxoheptanedioate aldolase